MGKRRSRPLPGDRKFHAPKAKRILQEAPGDPAGMDPEVPAEGKTAQTGVFNVIFQEGRDEEIGSGRALGSPKEGISDGVEENHLEVPQLGILEVDGTGEDELQSPKSGILDGPGENYQESPKLAILEVDGAGEEQLESLKVGILDGTGGDQLESPRPGILEVDGAGEKQLESPKPGILDGAGENCRESPKPAILEVDGAGEEPPESVKLVILDGMGQNRLESSQRGILEGDGAGKEQLESLKVGILDGTGEEQLESPRPGILEGDGAGEEQLESPRHGISGGAAEEQPEPVKPGIPEADGAGEELPEPNWEIPKLGVLDGTGENERESPKQGDSGAHQDTAMDTAPEESSEGTDAAGEGQEGALEDGCGTGIALGMDTGPPDGPRGPQSGGGDAESRNSQGGNSRMATPGLDPAGTSTEPQEQQEGTSPELPAEKPWDTTGQIHTGSTQNSPWESAKAAELADASDVVRGLIRELSDLNRLAMGARRGLELLRRPKPRRGRRAVPSGSRWKEG